MSAIVYRPTGVSLVDDFNNLYPQTWGSTKSNWPMPPAGNSGYRINLTANVNLTGVVAQLHGTVLLLFNQGNTSGYLITIKHNSVASAAGNKFLLPQSSPLEIFENIYIRYDETLSLGVGAWHLLKVWSP